jgi:rubrerythrin
MKKSTVKRAASRTKLAAKKAAAPKKSVAVKKPAAPKKPAAVKKTAAPKKAVVAQAKSHAAAGIASIEELMAYAYALEVEASERYAEFADAMEMHNNREVAELFRKLARIEHRHAEQVLEEMNWMSAPSAPHSGYKWEGFEAPETGDVTELHYLMQPYHALQIALHNEKRAYVFFGGLVKHAGNAKVKKAAVEMEQEEAEHVRLIEEWLKRTPKPSADWAVDPDPPFLAD